MEIATRGAAHKVEAKAAATAAAAATPAAAREGKDGKETRGRARVTSEQGSTRKEEENGSHKSPVTVVGEHT